MKSPLRATWRLIRCLAGGLFAGLLVCGSVSAAPLEYSFGVVPQFEQRKLFAIWRPIIEDIAQRSGVPLRFVVALSVKEFEGELARGTYDFVYTNPYHILRESTHQGYIPLVRDAEPLRGIIVVAKDSRFKTPADLAGSKLAIPSPNALGASLLVRADLERLFKVQVDPVNVNTHSSVYMHVANGLLPAGGGVEKTFSEQEAAIRDLLRVLYVTREMPSHPISAHPRVPAKLRTAVQQAILELAATPNGQSLLDKVPMRQPVPSSIKDYTSMRNWGLDRYWTD